MPDKGSLIHPSWPGRHRVREAGYITCWCSAPSCIEFRIPVYEMVPSTFRIFWLLRSFKMCPELCHLGASKSTKNDNKD